MRSRAMMVLVLATFLSCSQPQVFPDLSLIEELPSKGRFQDHHYNPKALAVETLISGDPQSIPFLIERLDSEVVFPHLTHIGWPVIHEGDLALVLLTDLFLDPTWSKSSLRELCWDVILERNLALEASTKRLLDSYIARHGRSALQQHWTRIWSTYRDRLYWEPNGRFFRIRDLELVPCQATE